MPHQRSYRTTTFRNAAMLSSGMVASEDTCEQLTAGSDHAARFRVVSFLVRQRPLAGKISGEAMRTRRCSRCSSQIPRATFAAWIAAISRFTMTDRMLQVGPQLKRLEKPKADPAPNWRRWSMVWAAPWAWLWSQAIAPRSSCNRYDPRNSRRLLGRC